MRAGPGGLEIVHPEYRRLLQADSEASEATLTPFYPGTEGLQQGRLRGLIAQALRALEHDPLPDVLPRERVASLHLPTLSEALRYVHAPPADARLDELLAGRHPAQRRLAFEELLAHQLSLRMLHRAADVDPSWPLPRPDARPMAHIRASRVSTHTAMSFARIARAAPVISMDWALSAGLPWPHAKNAVGKLRGAVAHSLRVPSG